MAVSTNVIEALRERVEILEEENRQLKEAIGIVEKTPNRERMRLLGISPTGYKLLVLLSKRKMVLKSTIIQSLWPTGDEPDTAMSIISVQLHRLRKFLRQREIEIRNARGTGWSLDDDDRNKVSAIILELRG